MTHIGIDVSEHNGKVDWSAVKQDGITFAMLRAGYGSDRVDQDDAEFKRNVSGCEANGIPWGAYLYSYALNQSEAESEAEHMFRLLHGLNPGYPISFDIEDADNYKQNHGMPSNHQLVEFCDKFCSMVENEGYYASIYASLSWLNTKLNDSRLNAYDKWVAQWTDNKHSDYEGSHQMWQYTSKGKVSGINGFVDKNKAYYDFNSDGHKSATIYHTIEYGDTLSEIAAKYNVSQSAIQNENNISNPNKIIAGEKIKIPKG